MRSLMRMTRLFSWILLSLTACGSDSRGENPDAAAQPGPDANLSAPTCVIDGPTNGTATGFDVAVTLAARANDREDGTLTGTSIVWTTNLQTAALGTGDFLMTTLPAGTNAVTCTVTDSNGNTGSASVNVISKSPYAKINHPSEGEMRPASQGVPFVGIGKDQQDGDLTGAALVWTSNLDGALGTGVMFNRQLSVGVHTITLTVTDTNNNTDATTISLTMQ